MHTHLRAPRRWSGPFVSVLNLLVTLCSRTEKLLATTLLFNDLHKAWLQLLNGWDMAGEDTHLSGLGGNVDLHAAVWSVLVVWRAHAGVRASGVCHAQ